MLTPRATVGFDGTKTIERFDAELRITGVEVEDLVWVEVSTQDS